MADGKTVKDLKTEAASYLPHSVEDENYIISQMYYRLEDAERITNLIEVEDFFDRFNKRVAKVAFSLTDMGERVSSHTVTQEIARKAKEEGKELDFDTPTMEEMQSRYQTPGQILDRENLDGAIRRVKQDRSYREIIYRANDALLMARCREGSPEDIVAPLEELSIDVQKKKGSVIVWADEAERKAQENYKLMDEGKILTVPTGFPEVDKNLWGGGKAKGDLILVAGATSFGKTTFCLNMSANAGELAIPSLYFSSEMEVFKIFNRQLSSRAKIPGYKIRPHMSKLYPELNIREKLNNTGAEMAKLPIGYIDKIRDMESLRRVCKFAVREFGIREAYIDLLGHFKPYKKYRGSTYDKVSDTAELAKEIAQELGITITACVQLRRKDKTEKNGKETGDAEGNLVEPTLDMLKNSGELENSADTVIFLWGEKGKEGELDAIRHIYGRVAKQREGALFPFELKFAPSIFTFVSSEKLRDLRNKMEDAEF